MWACGRWNIVVYSLVEMRVQQCQGKNAYGVSAADFGTVYPCACSLGEGKYGS
jgi:hypothetical protein